jgi:hypothetical protein
MLQFLEIVLSEFLKTPVRNQLRKSSQSKLIKFLEPFILTIAKCIPHHLNEEIFLLCEHSLELRLSLTLKPCLPNDELIQTLVESLTDKYTMRSKAHKRLVKYFLTRVIVEESLTLISWKEPTTSGDNEAAIPKLEALIH